MKNRTPHLLMVLITLLILLFQGIALGDADTSASLEGIWLGTLKVPGVELRIALTFSKSDEGTYTATMNSIDQGSGEIPMTEVRFENGQLFVKGANIGIEFEGKVDFEKDVFDSEFRQGPGKFPLVFQRVDALPLLLRPQEPKPPYPYQEEPVEYENEKAAIKIAGTLTFPETGGPFPAVILLSGSGAQNRDEELFGHKPFWVLADYLTRQGIAVLRTDDRGVGGTGGSFKGATTADFADDALAGVKYLQSRKEINPKLIGLVGHSEGGMMAPIAAAKSKDVAFIVLMAGVGVRFDDVILFQKETMWKKLGMSEEDLALQRTWHNHVTEIAIKDKDDETVREELKALYAQLSEDEKSRLHKTPEALEGEIKWVLDPWHRYASKYDATATLSQVKCPVLAINGSKDLQVSAQANLAAIEKGLKAGHNPDYMVKELAGLNHLFQTAETGDESEYTKIAETMSPEAMKLIADWIKKHTQ